MPSAPRISWQEALADYQRNEPPGPDDGWLILRHPDTGDMRGYAPFDLPPAAELEQLLADGWRVDRPN